MPATSAYRRVVLTFLDQSVSSVSNFIAGVAVARLAGAAAFGRYMLVLMIWFSAVGLHRALISEPVIIKSRNAQPGGGLQEQGVAAEVVLGLAGSMLVAACGGVAAITDARMGVLMLALSPWFVPLLIQDYWRAMAFQDRRPELALLNDIAFAVVQIAAIGLFSLMGWRSAGYMIAAWGIGATAGALLGFAWFRAAGGLRDGWALIGRLWPDSRWILAEFVTGFLSNQSYLAFAALLLSQVDYGGFRAAANLMGPVVVIIHAGSNVGLPEAARRANPGDLGVLRQLARRLSTGATVCVAIYGAVVAVMGSALLEILYGPQFARFDVLATLAALSAILATLVFGQGIALKASGRMQRLWRVRIVVTGGSLISMFLLVRSLGTVGAGWAGVATAVYYAGGLYAVYRGERRRPVVREEGIGELVLPSAPLPTSTTGEL